MGKWTTSLGTASLAVLLLVGASGAQAATAVFAGGCFWSVEKTFDSVRGVTQTVSGFAGGQTPNPTYNQVVRGGTGYFESVQVTYDPAVVSYDQLLDVYFRSIDPTDPSGQFCDKGDHYRTVVFAGSEAERRSAEAAKAAVGRELGAEVTTRIQPASTFYAAGDEHQDFHIRNAAHYERYRIGCGRDQSLARVWGTRAFKTASSG